MLVFDDENEKPLLKEKYDNIFNNFEEKNLIELNINKLFLNKKNYINRNILEKNEFKIVDNRKHYYSKSSEQKRKINNNKEKTRKNIELFDLKNNKNDEIEFFDFESKKIGFPNLGNTCYMNSFLQILIHI